MTIINITRSAVVCERVLLGDGPLLRMRGLMGRRTLPRDRGILLRPAPAIHTAFMRFPIDALFLDRDLLVLRVVDGLRPWRAAAQRGAHAVLELASGERAGRGVEVGDRLALLELADAPRAVRPDVEEPPDEHPVGSVDTAAEHVLPPSRTAAR
jgi:uncharacterized protein